MAQANIHAARGVALREFPLEAGYGFADYLLYIDGKAAGIIEAKKAGATLTGVESQSVRYAASGYKIYGQERYLCCPITLRRESSIRVCSSCR